MKSRFFHLALYSIIVYFNCATLNAIADNGPTTPENHNVMLRVGYVEIDRVNFASLVPTLDIKLRESDVLKYYEVVIWEETSSVHFYEFPNDFDSWYGYDITHVAEDGTLSLRRNDVTDEQKIAYREQFLISKYTDMPEAWTNERSTFLKSVFIDIASYLADRHPRSDHHLKYNGHGGPGGRLFNGYLKKVHAYEFLEFWSQSLGRPLGVIDMGGPCNKGSFADLDNFSEHSRYYIASDLLNGGYTMDEFTWSKREEVRPLTQYHNLFSANQSLEEALKGRIDLKRKAYEYSKNNMISNQVDQANYLYSCAAFRRFSPNFKAFLGSADVDYHISDDLYQYMIDNKAPPTLIEQFNDVFVHSADNKDFFEWSEVRNGMLMPDQELLNQLRQPRPHTLEKVSDKQQQGAPGAQLVVPFVVEVRDQYDKPLPDAQVTFTVTAGGGTLSVTNTTTDANGRAQSLLTLGPNPGTQTVSVSAAGIEVLVIFNAISDTESPPITADVNNDGSVNILDLILIASDLGNVGTNLAADVNRDGVVSILDLVLAAGMFEGTAAAPAAHAQAPKTLTAVEVQGWLTDARALEVRDPIMKRGFLVLEQLLAALTPTETELLPNYPNPFNPETWIPYRLAEDAFVTLTIYDQSGHVIRTLDVGHRIASAYENRSKAIYWDGRNGLGEPVASGLYFYTLTAGNFSATRKMVILK